MVIQFVGMQRLDSKKFFFENFFPSVLHDVDSVYELPA